MKVTNYEALPFRQFTGRAELDKVLNSLTGILEGITVDKMINPGELAELKHWCNLYRAYADKHPFNELLPILDSSLEDNYLSSEELEDIYWLVKQLRGSSTYYDVTSASLQRLHGLLHGVLADNVITGEELRGVQEWLEEFDFLKGVYPYDEIEGLLTAILADGIITAEERDMARAFFGEFVDTKASLNLSEPELRELKGRYDIKGICAVAPEVTIPGSVFCLTGASARAQRNGIGALIEAAGGVFRDNVNRKTNYLVVGAAGNPCWAFSCYGRKVESAVELKKAGHRITILHENDLWDELIPYAECNGIDCDALLLK